MLYLTPGFKQVSQVIIEEQLCPRLKVRELTTPEKDRRPSDIEKVHSVKVTEVTPDLNEAHFAIETSEMIK